MAENSGPHPEIVTDDGAGGAESPLLNEDVCEHQHYSQRSNWLRAFVLGANDGLVSVGALMMGVSGANTNTHQLLLSGIAGLVAGALSMAAGEYVSVSTQADSERADVEKERQAQLAGPEVRAHELDELTQIYVSRGLNRELARQVAEGLTAHDAVRAHARDELGIDIDDHPDPWQAAIASAVAFAFGAAIPLAPLLFRDTLWQLVGMVVAVTLGLLLFGGMGGYLGGSSVLRNSLRVLVGGWIAMAITYGVGKLIGADPA